MIPSDYCEVGHHHTDVHLWAWVKGRLHAERITWGGDTHGSWLSSMDIAFKDVTVYGRIDHKLKQMSAVLIEPKARRQAEYALDHLCDDYPDYDLSKWGAFI